MQILKDAWAWLMSLFNTPVGGSPQKKGGFQLVGWMVLLAFILILMFVFKKLGITIPYIGKVGASARRRYSRIRSRVSNFRSRRRINRKRR